MKKIISLFQRNYDGDRLVRDEIVPGAEWVVDGEGIATRKFDGSACMIRAGVVYKRYDCKPGRTPPQGWEPCEDAPDPNTGHFPGWVPVRTDAPEDKWFVAAYHLTKRLPPYAGVNLMDSEMKLPDGTYEACGPHFQGGAEKDDPQFTFGMLVRDLLIRHGVEILDDCPRDFNGLKTYFENHHIEGVVWHHPDGRMVKIKGKDFGIKRPKRQ